MYDFGEEPERAVVRLRDHKAYLRTPYNAQFVSWLKVNIPPTWRSWDKLRRQWIIDQTYWKRMLDILFNWYGEENVAIYGTFETETPRESFAGPQRTSDELSQKLAILGLLPGAPAKLIQAAYRAMAQTYHPDHADGDVEKMKALNSAYEWLCEHVVGLK